MLTGPTNDGAERLLELFDALVDVMFCVKDLDCRYVAVNSAFVWRSGKRSRREVIGATAADLFPSALAALYEAQDREVFETDMAMRDELELIRRPDGSIGWYLTTKLPLHDDGAVSGLVSVSRDLRTPDERGIELESLGRVVEAVQAGVGEPVRVAELAQLAGCTTGQLERRMRKVFGLSPNQYVLRVRVHEAAQRLVKTDEAIAEIAAATGFYDQASFTKQFARLTGETPAQFRASAQRSDRRDHR